MSSKRLSWNSGTPHGQNENRKQNLSPPARQGTPLVEIENLNQSFNQSSNNMGVRLVWVHPSYWNSNEYALSLTDGASSSQRLSYLCAKNVLLKNISNFIHWCWYFDLELINVSLKNVRSENFVFYYWSKKRRCFFSEKIFLKMIISSDWSKVIWYFFW